MDDGTRTAVKGAKRHKGRCHEVHLVNFLSLAIVAAPACQTRNLNNHQDAITRSQADRGTGERFRDFAMSPWVLIPGAFVGFFAPIVIHNAAGSPFEFKFASPDQQMVSPAVVRSIEIAADDGRKSLEDLGVVAHESGIVQIVNVKGQVVQTIDAFEPRIAVDGGKDFVSIDQAKSKVSPDGMQARVVFVYKRTWNEMYSMTVTALDKQRQAVALNSQDAYVFEARKSGSGPDGDVVAAIQLPGGANANGRLEIKTSFSDINSIDVYFGAFGFFFGTIGALVWGLTNFQKADDETHARWKILQFKAERLGITTGKTGASVFQTLQYFSPNLAETASHDALDREFLRLLAKTSQEKIPSLQEEFGKIALARGF